MSDTQVAQSETLEEIWCANCGNQIYQSGDKWYHLSTAGMSCNIVAKATPPASAAPVVDNKCLKCGHNTTDRHGECRQCIDWNRHKCVFTADTRQVCRHCHEEIHQTYGWVHTSTNLAICKSSDELFRAVPATTTAPVEQKDEGEL